MELILYSIFLAALGTGMFLYARHHDKKQGRSTADENPR